MPRIIATIIDTLSNDLAAGAPLIAVPHAAVAIRFFGDVASHPESAVGKHFEDYHLVQLGVLEDDLTITPRKEVLLTGAQWRAAQQTSQNS